MARVNPISDGQPLTYELLNQIINAVNDIKVEQRDIRKSIIDVIANNIKGDDDEIVKVRLGTLELEFIKGEAGARKSVTWGSRVTFTEKPFVAISVEDPTEKNIVLPVPVLFNVTKEGFSVRAKRLTAGVQDGVSADTLLVHYIAIGPSRA